MTDTALDESALAALTEWASASVERLRAQLSDPPPGRMKLPLPSETCSAGTLESALQLELDAACRFETRRQGMPAGGRARRLLATALGVAVGSEAPSVPLLEAYYTAVVDLCFRADHFADGFSRSAAEGWEDAIAASAGEHGNWLARKRRDDSEQVTFRRPAVEQAWPPRFIEDAWLNQRGVLLLDVLHAIARELWVATLDGLPSPGMAAVALSCGAGMRSVDELAATISAAPPIRAKEGGWSGSYLLPALFGTLLSAVAGNQADLIAKPELATKAVAALAARDDWPTSGLLVLEQVRRPTSSRLPAVAGEIRQQLLQALRLERADSLMRAADTWWRVPDKCERERSVALGIKHNSERKRCGLLFGLCEVLESVALSEADRQWVSDTLVDTLASSDEYIEGWLKPDTLDLAMEPLARVFRVNCVREWTVLWTSTAGARHRARFWWGKEFGGLDGARFIGWLGAYLCARSEPENAAEAWIKSADAACELLLCHPAQPTDHQSKLCTAVLSTLGSAASSVEMSAIHSVLGRLSRSPQIIADGLYLCGTNGVELAEVVAYLAHPDPGVASLLVQAIEAARADASHDAPDGPGFIAWADAVLDSVSKSGAAKQGQT